MSERDKEIWKQIRDEKAKQQTAKQQRATNWAQLSGGALPSWMEKLKSEGQVIT